MVAPNELPASEADIRLLVHVLDGEAQGVGAEECVGVEQNDITALCGFEGEIVGGAEAEIDAAAHDLYMREFGLNHFHGTIVGVVVHHEDFETEITLFARDRLQGLTQHIPSIEGDDDERYVEGVRGGFVWRHQNQALSNLRINTTANADYRREFVEFLRLGFGNNMDASIINDPDAVCQAKSSEGRLCRRRLQMTRCLNGRMVSPQFSLI